MKKNNRISHRNYKVTIIANVLYGDEERKLCDMLLANVLSMKNIVKEYQCIGMWKFKEEEKDRNYNHFWVCGLFGN